MYTYDSISLHLTIDDCPVINATQGSQTEYRANHGNQSWIFPRGRKQTVIYCPYCRNQFRECYRRTRYRYWHLLGFPVLSLSLPPSLCLSLSLLLLFILARAVLELRHTDRDLHHE